MKTFNKSLIITGAISLMAQPVFAQGVTQHYSQAFGNSAQAVVHVATGTLKLASGSLAVPFYASSAIGRTSGQANKTLWDIANKPIGTPLPITDKTISAGPSPNEAILLGKAF